MKIALAILTYVPKRADRNVIRRLPEALNSLRLSSDPNWKKIIIVDDGSTNSEHLDRLQLLKEEGFKVIRKERNGGVCKAKNTCIKALSEMDIDVGFIAEDDIEFKPYWWVPYVKAHQAIPEIHHYSWAWDNDPSGSQLKTEREFNGHTIARSARLNGVFLSFTKEVVSQVGGFKILPERWGHTHTNWTKRIIKAGLSPFYCDVVNSNDYIGLNKYADFSPVSDEHKKEWAGRNSKPAEDLTIRQPLSQ